MKLHKTYCCPYQRKRVISVPMEPVNSVVQVIYFGDTFNANGEPYFDNFGVSFIRANLLGYWREVDKVM